MTLQHAATLLIDNGALTVNTSIVGPGPSYEIRADIGYCILFRWQGRVIESGLAALAAELANLAVNVRELR